MDAGRLCVRDHPAIHYAVIFPMSRNNTLEHTLADRARQAGGGHMTIQARIHTVSSFTAWCRESNRQISDIRNRDARDYVRARINAGITTGTMQKEVSHLRAVAPSVSYTNAELGIAGRDRTGDKRPLTAQEYRERHDRIRDPGVRAAAELQRTLGLRAMEAVRAGASLKDWERALTRGDPVRVIHGTKGGRLRNTEVPNRADALAAVRGARDVARERGGQLIDAKTLKSAAKRYERAMSRAGFSGRLSPHALRYGYARQLMAKYTAEGMRTSEARAAVSLSLGHGDGRGRYVASVYLRG